MAIAFDAVSSSTAPDGGWTHTPVGTPKGVVVFYMQVNHTDVPSGCTYGGVALSPLQDARDSTETGLCQVWFLGAGIPTGAQTVDFNNTGANAGYGTAITVTAGADTELAGTGSGKVESASVTNPSVTITGISGASYGFGGVFSGQNTLGAVTAGSGMTVRGAGTDFGNQVAKAESSTSENASGDLTIAFTIAAEDAGMTACAIQEKSAAVASKKLALLGVG